jgi:hypothetical protein
MPSKKLKLPIIDLYSIYVAILEVEKVNTAMPFKLSWDLDDIKEIMKKPCTRFEEQRLKVLREVGKERDGFPGQFEIEPDKKEEFTKQLEEINNVEVELEINTIPLALFETAKDFQFATGTFAILRKYVIEFPEKKVKEEKPEMAAV